jgi:hypothetical protein
LPIVIRKSAKFNDQLKNNLRIRYEERKKSRLGVAPIHVSDILPTTCIRKQYYSRVFPEKDPISDESVHHFVRGEASEFVITQLANMGVSQADLEFSGIVAHPDIMGSDLIVELKDTVNGKRLDITDQTFRSYLRQLLYYIVITGFEKGIISIRYNIKELRWIRGDKQGDYYFRPKDANIVGTESWEISLPKQDITREIIKNEMVRRKNLFLRAIEERNPSILPRLVEPMKSKKCPSCPFYDICMDQDGETEDARLMALEKDLLDISGVIDFKPSIE